MSGRREERARLGALLQQDMDRLHDEMEALHSGLADLTGALWGVARAIKALKGHTEITDY